MQHMLHLSSHNSTMGDLGQGWEAGVPEVKGVEKVKGSFEETKICWLGGSQNNLFRMFSVSCYAEF